MKLILAFVLTALVLISPASARTVIVGVEKLQPKINVTFITVRGGTVTGLPKRLEPAKFEITVTLPDDKCIASLSVVFDNNTRNEIPMNFCGSDLGIRIGTPKPMENVGPPAHPQEECKAIIAKQNTSKAAMIEAGMLYFHGMRLGEKCVTVDYKRAFDLLRAAHDSRTFNTFLGILKQRAASGNPKAISALEKIDLSPVAP